MMTAYYRSKYGNTKFSFNGEVFDSKLEYQRYIHLKLLERAKQISGLQRQVKFVLIDKSKHGRQICYIADFTYNDNGKFIVEDTKSNATKTPVYRLKKRLLEERYNIKIKEVYKEEV